MCIIRAMKRLEQVRQLSVVLHLRQAHEWCGLLKISIIGESWNIEDKILFNEIKGLILIADRRTAETSGVGLSAILLWLISGCPFRLFGAKVWQTDRHRSDKRQCYGQDQRRIIAWGYSYIILVTM